MAPAPLLSDSAGDINGLVPRNVDTAYVVTGEAINFMLILRCPKCMEPSALLLSIALGLMLGIGKRHPRSSARKTS